MSFTIGSLFDGSGGFPLAAFMSGGVPLWASEIEPYPIAVTKSRFPYMKHLGSITEIKGNEVRPVDVITFGSPCQDLSVAGKRAGLKHEDNGDDETTRSGLFMEAVRIIKEMREKTNGKYPRFAVWENVPGAFSSNKGEDFRIVLEELIKIVEPTATMPSVPPYGWPYADNYIGDGWSLAYRVFDAQYWGVPQRRRRIYLVLDLRGQCARKVLFEREGLRGHFEESRTSGEEITADVKRCVGADDSARGYVAVGYDGYNQALTGDVSKTITSARSDTDHIPCVIEAAGFCTEHSAKSRSIGYEEETSPTLRAGVVPAVLFKADDGSSGNVAPTLVGDHNNRVTDHTALVVCEETIALEGNGQRPSHHGDGYVISDKSYTLNSTEVHGVAYGVEEPIILDRAFYNQGQNALYEPQLYESGIIPPIVAKGPSAICYSTSHGSFHIIAEENKVNTLMGTDYKDPPTVAYSIGNGQVHDAMTPNKEVCKTLNCMDDPRKVCIATPSRRYIVRRLTPTECARLQGFPDFWGYPDVRAEFTDEEYKFWLDVRNTHAEINGRAVKDYNRKQMLTWYNKLHTDSSEYKMWGNGIALPCAIYIMEGIAEVF